LYCVKQIAIGPSNQFDLKNKQVYIDQLFHVT